MNIDAIFYIGSAKGVPVYSDVNGTRVMCFDYVKEGLFQHTDKNSEVHTGYFMTAKTKDQIDMHLASAQSAVLLCGSFLTRGILRYRQHKNRLA